MQEDASRSRWSEGLRALLLAVVCAPAGANARNTPVAPAPDADAKRIFVSGGITGIIAPGTRIEFLRGGFDETEGVVRMPDGSVLFCEMEADRVIRIDPAGNFFTYLDDVNRPVGLAYDPAGRLVATQSRDPRVGVLSPGRVTLADSFEGQPLVKPNDLVIDSRGGIYFSDPLSNPKTKFREPPPGRKSLLLYVRPDGSVTKPTDAIGEPHKIMLSPDEKKLYAGDGDRIAVFNVRPDGSLVEPRTFADIRGEDLVVDRAGRVNVSTDEGIDVLSNTGQVLGVIPTPIHIQNFAFAGVDRTTIFAVGHGNVYRIAMLAQGIENRQK